MKKIVKVEFFSDSRKWPRRVPKIKTLTFKTIKIMNKYLKKNYTYYLNLILTDKKRMIKLNKVFKKKQIDTDVLTFITKYPNKILGKTLYCDIFFSIDTIENFIKNKNLDIYEHFNHLLVHSILHINGYDHKKIDDFNKMKKVEIKILKKLDISNPYELK